MTGLCIPVGWFCGLLVSQAAWYLLVFSSFSLSSPVHWPGEGADSLLCAESSLFFLLYLFLSSSGFILLCCSGFCFLSFPLCHWQFLFVSACLLMLVSWPASLSVLKWSLKPSSQIRRKAVATSSYFRCWTSSVKGIVRSLQTWPFPSVEQKGSLSLFIPNYSSPRPYPEGGGLKVMLLTCSNGVQIPLPPPVPFLLLHSHCLLTLAVWSTSRVYVTSEMSLMKRVCNIIIYSILYICMCMYVMYIYTYMHIYVCICNTSPISHFKALPPSLLPGSVLLCQSCSWQFAHSQVPLLNFLHGQQSPPKYFASQGIHVHSPILDTICPAAD